MSERRRPFSQGTQYLDWQEANCCRCRKYHVKNGEVVAPICELEEALALACIGDGMISGEHAARLGLPENTWSRWKCLEFEPEGLPEDIPCHKPHPDQMELFL